MLKLIQKSPNEILGKRPEVYCKRYIPLLERAVTMLYSVGGVGKSYTAIRIAIEYVLETGKVASLWLTEDDIIENKERFLEICHGDFYDKIDYLQSKVKFIDCAPIKISELQNGNYELRKEFYEARLNLYESGMVVLDPLVQFAGCDENSNTGAGVVMGGLKEWAKEENKIILVLHHSSKPQKNSNGGYEPPSSRGAGEWVNGCRAVYTVGSLADGGDSLMFQLTKNNGVSRYFRNQNNGELSRVLKVFGKRLTDDDHEDNTGKMKHRMSFADHNSVSPEGFISDDVSYFYDLHEKLTNGRAYSQYEFEDGYRLGANNLGSASVICLDFDDGKPTLAEAVRKFSKIKSLIITTRSHQKDKGADKPACDRFRVVIPLKTPLSIPIDQYSDFLNALYSKIGSVDPSTKDIARFFFASPEDAIFHYSDSEKLMDWQPIYDKMMQDNVKKKLEKKLKETTQIPVRQYSGRGKPQNTLPKETIIETKNSSTTLETLRMQLTTDEKYPCKCVDGIDHGGLGEDHLSAFVKKDSNGNVFYSCSGGRCASKGTLWCEE